MIVNRGTLTIYMFAFMILVAVLYIVRHTVLEFFISLYKCICCRKDRLKVLPTSRFGTYSEEYKIIS